MNIFLAAPAERGKGYGTEVQRLAREHLEAKRETYSVFAVTEEDNQGERRALEKAGFGYAGSLRNDYYRVPQGPGFVLYVAERSRQANNS